ncbi:unnamed protein product [Gongylonema pulchrum]|uniref:FLZ-type domain-containing protein n=1 Tax=Gongylonema pulchrum TaxID=637853 RepID=A0A183EHN2_9BILA|nr:unnamed protein product [Gongylonema pulchrum]
MLTMSRRQRYRMQAVEQPIYADSGSQAAIQNAGFTEQNKPELLQTADKLQRIDDERGMCESPQQPSSQRSIGAALSSISGADEEISLTGTLKLPARFRFNSFHAVNGNKSELQCHICSLVQYTLADRQPKNERVSKILGREKDDEEARGIQQPSIAHSQSAVCGTMGGVEITRCYCGMENEDDFMIQCDLCKCVLQISHYKRNYAKRLS